MLGNKLIAAVILSGIIAGTCLSQERPLFLQIREGGGQSGASAPAVPAPRADANYSMQTFWLEYLTAKEMRDTIKDILAEGEGVTSNNESNSLIVRASRQNIDRVAAIIQKLDKPPMQVHVEAKIIELKSGQGDTSNPSTMGFSWQYTRPSNANDLAQFYASAAPTLGAVSTGLYAQLLSGDVSAYLQALERRVGYDFVAAPWITALNNKEAEILIGGKIGYRNLLTTTTGTLQEVQYISVGTKLRFTPRISRDGYIRMEIYPSLSDGALVDGVPQETVTETKNHVLVKDGQTIVIGGLTKNYKNEVTLGVPVLSSIPIIGTLFRRKEVVSEKRDLMVLITPHIVTPEFLGEMQKKAAELEGKQDKSEPSALDLVR